MNQKAGVLLAMLVLACLIAVVLIGSLAILLDRLRNRRDS